MQEEEPFIALSALQHYLYCPRQCALIHLEQLWEENEATAEGRVLHERVDAGVGEKRKNHQILRSLHLSSLSRRIAGISDVVEIQKNKGKVVSLLPIEYKRGEPKEHRADEVQVCAQALCLEEMFGLDIAQGALFYGKKQRRFPVLFDQELRDLTEHIISETRALLSGGKTPPAEWKPSCGACSLLSFCLPVIYKKSQQQTGLWVERRLEESFLLEEELE